MSTRSYGKNILTRVTLCANGFIPTSHVIYALYVRGSRTASPLDPRRLHRDIYLMLPKAQPMTSAVKCAFGLLKPPFLER